jgi:O-methyltransferase involved in polyketide biosynthesis
MADKQQVRLGAVQETLFITLAARAAESQRKHPVLRDPDLRAAAPAGRP